MRGITPVHTDEHEKTSSGVPGELVKNEPDSLHTIGAHAKIRSGLNGSQRQDLGRPIGMKVRVPPWLRTLVKRLGLSAKEIQ